MSIYTLLNGYVGNKAPYTSKIKALFDPTCTKYFEPFAGGASIYFSHYNGRYQDEGLNDRNPNIALLYMSLADEETREATIHAILSIEKPDDENIAKEQFRNAQRKMLKPYCRAREVPKEKRVELCRDIFIVYSQSFNCAGKSYSKQKSNAKYKIEVKRNLMNAVDRLKEHPTIYNADGIEMIKKVKNQSETQLFVDWPYVGLYRSSSKLYQTEMAGLYDHIRGAEEMADSKAAVVMCDYRSQYEGVPTIYDAILGDDWHCFKLADTYKHAEVVKRGEHKRHAQEYVWTNRIPEYAELYLSMQDYKEKITIDEYWEKIRYACKNHLIPDKHIAEYCATYESLYDGQKLIDG